jgi:RNA polymerase sigma factor (TIGR02999 family)
MVDQQGPERREFTRLLNLAFKGDKSAAEEVMPAIQNELRKIASIHMSRERPDHTLQTTAVVNEAYIRLRGGDGEWNDRQHFFSMASFLMRRLLVDHARRHAPKLAMDLGNVAVGPVSAQVLDVHKALKELEVFAPEEAKLVELRFFSGLSLEDAAAVLGKSPRTVDTDWKLAKGWLQKKLAQYGQDQ